MIDYTKPRELAICDTEAYIDYWSIAFERLRDNKIVLLEMYQGCPLDRERLALILRNHRLIGFNFAKYDVPMILLALKPGTTNLMLKRASDEIITQNLTIWKALERFDIDIPEWLDYIDLMEVSPGAPQRLSLKHTGARLHTHTVQELPITPDSMIGPIQRDALRSYVRNDLRVTKDLYREIRPAIEMREKLSVRYGMDLRSKSDAQMAEAILKKDVEATLGRRIYRPEVVEKTFRYKPPEWVQFSTPTLKALLDEIVDTDFPVDDGGIARIPTNIEGRTVTVGEMTYKLGIGGLHSQEESVTHFADEETTLEDNDVTSMYPNIIRTIGLVPPAMGEAFKVVYYNMLDERVAAKKRAKVLKEQIKALEKQIAELEKLNAVST
jgi:hypothetical protein